MKDPAFLFYSNDFLSGTMLMTDEEVGQYIKLLCLQHQKGHLKEKDMLNICKTYNEDIFSKFKKDDDGNYYNERLEEEVERRKKYSESRRNNRKKRNLEEEKGKTYVEDMKNICNSYEEHMETETTTTTININKIIEFYNNNINLITPFEFQKLQDYKNMDNDLIIYAMKKAVINNKRSFSYIDSILKSWKAKGFTKLIQAQNEEDEYRKGKQPIQETDEERVARKLKRMEEYLKNGT